MQYRNHLTIATRTSKLALAQTNIVKQLLQQNYPGLQISILEIKTTGDKILTTNLAKIGGKGLFTKELAEQILAGNADLAVHSMKDMPAQQPAELTIAAMLPRANPCDVIVSKNGYSLVSLPVQAMVGSSSLRRQAQLLTHRSDLQIKTLRGNVDTRVKQLYAGEYDAIILAKAGLDRLQLHDLPVYQFSQAEMLPAVGQGAIGIECKHSDHALVQMLAVLSDHPTVLCVQAERKMNACLNGSCSTPIAGYAEILAGNLLTLTGMVAHVDGSKRIFASAQDTLVSDKKKALASATALGEVVANALELQGARDIMARYV